MIGRDRSYKSCKRGASELNLFCWVVLLRAYGCAEPYRVPSFSQAMGPAAYKNFKIEGLKWGFGEGHAHIIWTRVDPLLHCKPLTYP